MKKIIEYSLITIFFILSLVYTNKVSSTIKNNDPIMKKILSNLENYSVNAVNAEINEYTITPGINGCTVDVNKSYKNMKKINEYNEKLLKYKDVIPEITLSNIYNKYISSGNGLKREVSIVINIQENIRKINSIATATKTKVNIFVDSNLLEDDLLDIDKEYIHMYNGGINNNYNDITIEWMNDVITDNYNKPKYCINKNRNDDNLLVCVRNRMHSISPTIIVSNNTLEVKELIKNGSIIYTDENNVDYIVNIINYIRSKGYEIVYLDELLNENMCK